MSVISHALTASLVAILLLGTGRVLAAEEAGAGALELERGAVDAAGWAPEVTEVDRVVAAETSPSPQGEGGGSYGLALQLANPVADLISVPIQANLDQGFGPTNAYRWTINFQPVVPFHLSSRWLLVSRTILPVVVREGILPSEGNTVGLGDTVQSFFLTSRRARRVIWGAGPVFLLPTATDDRLGARKWGAGPTAVILKQSGPWTYGTLANHIWSFADAGARDDGRGSRDVNATFLQPFVTYTFPSALTVGLSTEALYDWERAAWGVPINLTATQVTAVCRQLVSLGLGVRYWAESPDGGPEWGIRLTLTLLFPKR